MSQPVTQHTFKAVALAFAATLTVTCVLPVAAQTTQTDGEEVVEEVFVLGERRAYRGNFDNLEKPSADQTIDEDLLREAGAINLNQALDLSALRARAWPPRWPMNNGCATIMPPSGPTTIPGCFATKLSRMRASGSGLNSTQWVIDSPRGIAS